VNPIIPIIPIIPIDVHAMFYTGGYRKETLLRWGITDFTDLTDRRPWQNFADINSNRAEKPNRTDLPTEAVAGHVPAPQWELSN
jgi:hypothetical protein